MPKLEDVGVTLIDPDPNQPRKHCDKADDPAFIESIKKGQKLPGIAYRNNGRFTLIDGEQRWRAAVKAAVETVLLMVYDSKPTPAEIQLTQLTIDVFRHDLSAMERSNFLAKIQADNAWSVSQLVEHTSLKQSWVSKLLAYQKLAPDLQQLLHAGTFDTDKALTISQEPDFVKQLALASQAPRLSRGQLRRQVKGSGNGRPEARVSTARFAMPGGMTVSVYGPELTLMLVIEVIAEVLRILKRGQAQGLDIKTQQKVMADTAKPKK